MMVSLLVPLMLATASSVQFSEPDIADPRVRVWLSNDGEFERGDRARVYLRAGEDGYVVVLHADAQGRVRMLFPLDPLDDNFVRRGDSFEVRGRGDREAFLIEDRTGSGLLLAAWSPDPFRTERFARNDHWDYRLIAPGGVGDDPEAGLLDVVQQMTSNQFFEYDAAPYIIGDGSYRGSRTRTSFALSIGTYPRCFGCFDWHVGWRAGFHLSFGIGTFGWGFHDPYFYDPFYHDPFYYDPFFHHPIHHHYVWWRPIYVRPIYVKPIYYSKWWWQPHYWKPGPRYRSAIGVHIRYADCLASCGRYAKPRGRIGIDPGWATGWINDGSVGRPGGGATGGRGSGFGPGGQDERRAVRRVSGTVNVAWPSGGRRAEMRTESTEPLRPRIRPDVERPAEPTVTTTQPRRPRIAPDLETRMSPRVNTTEPRRSRAAPELERRAEPRNQPGRRSISEPQRSRVLPDVERRWQSTTSEPSRSSSLRRMTDRMETPERSSRTAVPRSSSIASRAPERSSTPSRMMPQRGAPSRSSISRPSSGASRSVPRASGSSSRSGSSSGIARSAARRR